MTSIKICGITNVYDAHNAITAGANYLGFIFVPSSDRSIDESKAREVLQAVSGRVKTVAVFKNSPLSDVNRLAKSLQFDFIQLHGSESPEYCQSIDGPVIKAIEINPDCDVDSLRSQVALYKNCAYILFDRPKGLDVTSWLDEAIDKVEALADSSPYFFAGGLNHTNVRRILNRISPHALDVASGVESAPGVKNMDKMIAFCDAVNDESRPGSAGILAGTDVKNEAVS
jgi:phosphoribosylanthranilate isomerase